MSASVRQQFEIECPKCHSDESLEVVVTCWARVTPDGTDTSLPQDSSHDWDDESTAKCIACDWVGTLSQARHAFTIRRINDCDVIESATLDNPELWLPWIVQLPDGEIIQFRNEEAACAFQRQWRSENGLNPITGEP